jgi:CDP-diacylglycerol---glycerol-3-phosphate 3-phosphatidyltransferase
MTQPTTSRAPASRWRARTPNALTVVRLAMTGACVVALSLYAGERPESLLIWVALGLFVVASATDALDGYLARRWNAISRFGRVMDPLADKVLVLGVLIVLSGPNFGVRTDEGVVVLSGVMAWMGVVALARELLVTSLRAAYESAGVDFSATWTGKAKMMAQVGGIVVILVGLALMDAPDAGVWVTINAVAAWVITFVTAVSALPYIGKAIAASRLLAEGR